MKLLRYGPAGKEKPGLLDSNGKIRDLSKLINDFDGDALAPASLNKISKLHSGYRTVVTCYLWRSIDPVDVDY